MRVSPTLKSVIPRVSLIAFSFAESKRNSTTPFAVSSCSLPFGSWAGKRIKAENWSGLNGIKEVTLYNLYHFPNNPAQLFHLFLHTGIKTRHCKLDISFIP